MSDNRKKSVRFDDRRSGSSRASTSGGSSTASSYSSTVYPEQYSDPRYNIAALEETVRLTLAELDAWKRKAEDAEAKLYKQQTEAKAHIAALEQSNSILEDDKKELEREVSTLRTQVEKLKEKNARLQKKLDRVDNQSEPSSPDGNISNHSNSGKPRRSESKRSKEKDKADESDKQSERLKTRLNRRAEDGSSTGSTSKPPSSSKMPHRPRRPSTSSHHGSEQPYSDGWGPSKPTLIVNTSPSSRRAEHQYVTAPRDGYSVASATIQSPAFSATPRSAGMVRGSVEYEYPHSSAPFFREDGNYHPYPLPPRQ